MALIHCVECGEKVSDAAPACPKCGYPLRELFRRQPSSPAKRGPGYLGPAGSVQKQGSGLAVAFSILMSLGLLFLVIGGLVVVISYTNYWSNVGVNLMLFGIIPILAAGVILPVWLYFAWSVIPAEYGEASPGMAIVLLFVPLFNLYWIFRVIPGLSAALGRVLHDRDPSRPHRTGFGVGLAACIVLLIPFVDILAPVLFWVWIIMANRAKNRVIELETSAP